MATREAKDELYKLHLATMFTFGISLEFDAEWATDIVRLDIFEPVSHITLQVLQDNSPAITLVELEGGDKEE